MCVCVYVCMYIHISISLRNHTVLLELMWVLDITRVGSFYRALMREMIRAISLHYVCYHAVSSGMYFMLLQHTFLSYHDRTITLSLRPSSREALSEIQTIKLPPNTYTYG